MIWATQRAAAQGILANVESGPMPPNVVCVVMDAARRDAFEPYGAPAGSSPVVADLARRGTALPHVFAAGCWTLPSHASMFTGLLPRAAGLADVGEGGPHAARPILETHRDRLLPEVLRRAGYATRAVSANAWVGREAGFDIGFEEFVAIDSGRQAELHRTDARGRTRWWVEAARARVDDGAGEALEVISSWLRRRATPFFWFVNVVECHSPYLPPRPYNDLSLLDRLRAADDNRRYLQLGTIWDAAVGKLRVPEDALARMRHLYARSIRYMDDWLGALLDAMDSAGVLDDTLVIIMSDHGENLGEDGRLAHVMSLDQRLLAVPFVVAGPGSPAAGGALSLAELPRLIAEAIGLDGVWVTEDLPTGVAISQCDPVVVAPEHEVREAALKWGWGEGASTLTTPLTCATDGRLKLLRVDQEEQLYDLEADPLERAPQPLDGELARAQSDTVAALRAALEHPAATARLDPAAVAAPAPEPGHDEVRQLEERMKLLGYM
jgi:sulfatase-like protein